MAFNDRLLSVFYPFIIPINLLPFSTNGNYIHSATNIELTDEKKHANSGVFKALSATPAIAGRDFDGKASPPCGGDSGYFPSRLAPRRKIPE